MAKIGLWFYTNEGGSQIRAKIVSELQNKGHEVIFDFDMRSCYAFRARVYTADGFDLSSLDIFYHMNADEQTPHQNEMLDALERSGVRVINSASDFLLAKDKFFANQRLFSEGIRVPDSALISATNATEISAIVMDQMHAVVVKPRNNHGGKGIMKFTSHEALCDYISATDHFFDSYYIERYINFGDHDYRVEILFDEVVGGYSRTKTHSFKTNVAAGGLMTPIRPGSQFEEIARSAAKSLGVEATIVDMVQEMDTGDIFVLEVNPIMGIFVESAMTNYDKSLVREIHPSFANDALKVEKLVAYLDEQVRQ